MKLHSFLISTAAISFCAVPLSAEDEVHIDSASGNGSTAAAQEGSEETDSSRTRRTFTPADFERFAPRSALDMAQQIPGFSIQSDDGNRGLGQANTNVIINGQRISGKSNGPVAALQRIPAEEVVRLEIVDGASLDIGGLSGQVLNVVTKSTGGITGQFRYSAEWRSFGVPFRWGDGQISLAGGGEKTEWTLSLENDAGRRGNEGIEQVFDAADILIDTRDEQSKFVSDRPSLSGSFARTANNGNILNLTGSIAANLFDRSETSIRTGTISATDRFRLFTSKEDEFNYEFGADYSFGLGDGTLKVIGYRRFEDSPTSSEVITTFADGSSPEGSLFIRDADEAETILRGEYSFARLGGDIQLALEGVQNSLDIDSTLEVRDVAGVLQPEEFDGSSARVEEDRAEGSLTYGRALTESLQMQLSAGGEYSTISQSGPLGQTRSFFRPKGFAALDWKANKTLNLSGRVERVVGQLNFFDFIASTDLNQDRVNVTNADLVPPQSWLFELEATQSLGAYGSINLRGFYEDLSDFVDQIPIDGGGEAPGNIDAAIIKGVEGEITLLLDPVGLQGLRFDAEFRVADSEILDPLLGTPRDISGFRNFMIDVEARKDFFGSDWAIGGAFRYSENRANVRLSEVAFRQDSPGFARAFVEHKDVLGMTARFRVGNLVNQKDNFNRTIFADRSNGIIDLREERRRVFGVIYSFDIEGSF
uniref:TonB-dependent receptor plug domain-containing protein n=1 Tax=uncultured Erythrobacter sp. TaxID=263913 RepID=UPI00260F884F|nr:TonB-dependent receptor plug domain-containing protein [uncultured Erythrobacter sp.]